MPGYQIIKEITWIYAKTNLLENNNGKKMPFTIVTKNKLSQNV